MVMLMDYLSKNLKSHKMKKMLHKMKKMLHKMKKMLHKMKKMLHKNESSMYVINVVKVFVIKEVYYIIGGSVKVLVI